MSREPKGGPVEAAEQRRLLDEWQAQGRQQAEQIRAGRAAEPALPAYLSLSAAIEIFLATLIGQSQATARTYRAGCRRLMWFIYSSGRGRPDTVSVSSLSPLVLEDFYLWLVETYGRQARATHAGYLAASRNLFEYLAGRDLTPGGEQYQKMIARLSKIQGRASYRTPRVKVRQIEQVARQAVEPAAKPGKRKPRQAGERQRQHLEELRDRSIILTLYTTGMRRQELAQLNRPDLEHLLAEAAGSEQAQIEVFQLLITGKGQKERLVYFDRITLEAIEAYLQARGDDGYRPLFLQHHRGRERVEPGPRGENYRVSLVTVWNSVGKFARRLGLAVKPHDFRHNLATTLLNAGAQLSEVQDILGHASPTTTKQIYAHYDQSHLREAFTRFRKSAGELNRPE